MIAALAESSLFDDRTGWSIPQDRAHRRRYRTVQIRVATYQRTAEDPASGDLHDALTKIHTIGGAH